MYRGKLVAIFKNIYMYIGIIVKHFANSELELHVCIL
jgi:hypothetical protein